MITEKGSDLRLLGARENYLPILLTASANGSDNDDASHGGCTCAAIWSSSPRMEGSGGCLHHAVACSTLSVAHLRSRVYNEARVQKREERHPVVILPAVEFGLTGSIRVGLGLTCVEFVL